MTKKKLAAGRLSKIHQKYQLFILFLCLCVTLLPHSHQIIKSNLLGVQAQTLQQQKSQTSQDLEPSELSKQDLAQILDPLESEFESAFESGEESEISKQRNVGGAKQISDINLLLPLSTCTECRKVRKLIYATNGCYKWETSHPSLIKMSDKSGRLIGAQDDSTCVKSVYLEANTLRETKTIIIVTARDKNSGQVLRCQVKVGKIDHIKIFTNFAQFAVNNNQVLKVVGFDDDQNVFSSLDGLRFDWQIEEGKDVVRKFQSIDTGLKTESSQVKTNMLFVRSVSAGKATISVRLIEPGYENVVKKTQTKLTIVEPFVVLPAREIFILPTSSYQFSLAYLNLNGQDSPDSSQSAQSLHQPIKLPNSRFKWTAENSKIGSVNSEGIFVSNQQEGFTEILVVDEKMPNNTAEASINVVNPYRIEVKIRDVTNSTKMAQLHAQDTNSDFLTAFALGADDFYDAENAEFFVPELDLADTHILVEDHYYSLKMFIFDKDGHQITLTDNLRFNSLNLDDKYVSVVQKNAIGSEIVIYAKKITEPIKKINSVHGLSQILLPKSQSNANKKVNQIDLARLQQAKELVITKPVKIDFPQNSILLPFLPQNPSKTSSTMSQAQGGEVWNLTAKGGSGVYFWAIVDPQVASVSGSATVRSQQVGKTQLIVKDHKNAMNWDAIEIEVAQIESLKWIEEQSEIQAAASLSQQVSISSEQSSSQFDKTEKSRGEQTTLSLFALDNKGRKFTNCTSISPKFEIKNNAAIEIIDKSGKNQPLTTRYTTLKNYVENEKNLELLRLKQRFDEQSQIEKSEDLDSAIAISDANIKLNVFGICAQVTVGGLAQGLGRVKASIDTFDYVHAPAKLLQSEFAEIAVYEQLKSIEPTYAPNFLDLFSQNQIAQEFQNFDNFYDSSVLNLQYGTEIDWKVVGGSNFWQKVQSSYKTSYKFENLRSQQTKAEMTPSMAQVLSVSEETAKFQIKLTCEIPANQTILNQRQDTRLILTQSSEQTRQLLRPAKHQISVQISCESPKSARLLWSQDVRPLTFGEPRLLPRSKIVHNQRTHYVLVNSRFSVRYLLLDSHDHVFLNTSSALAEVKSSNKSMAQIELAQMPLLENGKQPLMDSKRDLLSDIEQEIYDKRIIQFKDQIGQVSISVNTQNIFLYSKHQLKSGENDDTEKEDPHTGGWFSGGKQKQTKPKADPKSDSIDDDVLDSLYKSTQMQGSTIKFSNKPIYDSLNIKVVRNVDIEPKQKSLYIGGSKTQTFRLKILNGSGQFSVSLNDTQLADVVQNEREIFVTPKQEGSLKLTVEDLEVPHSVPASTSILISDIKKILLHSTRTLIEKDDSMELFVSAYDSSMQEFDEDQYLLMHFDIETEMTGIQRSQGLQITPIKNSNRSFVAFGHQPGFYQSVAFTYKYPYMTNFEKDKVKRGGVVNEVASESRQSIVSELLKIEVFPLLEVVPANLLLTPNMRFTLQIQGGPQTSSSRSQHLDGSHVEIKFEISDPQIASVDQHREVTAHRVGNAELRYEIIQLKQRADVKQQQITYPFGGSSNQTEQNGQKMLSRVVSKKSVPIRVRLVTDVELPGSHQRQIYTQGYVKINAILKHGEEYFNQGIAPISYSWNCTQGNILRLNLPSKSQLAQTHGSSSNLVSAMRYIRNNLQNDDLATFFTAFNSSSIYAEGQAEGEAIVQVLLAIDYPEEYKNEQNWFSGSAQLKVTEKLSINVPEYSQHESLRTSLLLLPPNTQVKLETNRQTRLRLGYSQQSVYDYSTQQYRYQDSSSAASQNIITLINNEAIQTNDKYGKVTVIVEEGSQGGVSDQIVMLNVLIADIYCMSSMNAYDALTLPLGSSLTLPLHFQNEHANRFAEKVEGLRVGVVISHPRVVKVTLNQYASAITLESRGSGDCNIVLYLIDFPQIFDVIRVKVSSLVKPLSPVYIHLGGEVNFIVDQTDGDSNFSAGKSQGREMHPNIIEQPHQHTWTSTDPSILSIDSKSGKSVALQQGKVDVMLSNHANSASIVHVSKISHAQLDQMSSLLLRTDRKEETYRGVSVLKIRIKLFLENQTEELMPVVQFEGRTLVRHNVNIQCNSEDETFVKAQGRVNDLEGFFCDIQHVSGGDMRNMPRFVPITVSVSGVDQNQKELYSEQILDFQIQLVSDITVESKFRKQASLGKNRRSVAIKIYSIADFKVQVDYGSPEETQLVLYSVEQLDSAKNEYEMVVQVPDQVSHSFDAKLVLNHPFALNPLTIPLVYNEDDYLNEYSNKSFNSGKQNKNQQVLQDDNTRSDYESQSYQQDQRVKNEQIEAQDVESPSILTYIIIIIFMILALIFLFVTVLQIDIRDMFFSPRQYDYGRRNNIQQGQYGRGFQQNIRMGNMSADSGIREPKNYKKQVISRDTSYNTDRSSYGGVGMINHRRFDNDYSMNSNYNQRHANGGGQSTQDQRVANLDDYVRGHSRHNSTINTNRGIYSPNRNDYKERISNSRYPNSQDQSSYY